MGFLKGPREIRVKKTCRTTFCFLKGGLDRHGENSCFLLKRFQFPKLVKYSKPPK